MTGILDEYPGAAAAYSLRLLNTDYTGDAIVVRRASDNTTQNIGFIDGELDTDALDTFCSGTDGFVATWYDQSGNGNDSTNATASEQPKIYDASTGIVLENSKPALSFNDAQVLRSDFGSGSTIEKSFAFVANEYSTSSLFTPIIDSYDETPNERIYTGRDSSNFATMPGSGATITNGFATYADTQILSFTNVDSSGNVVWNIDSNQVATGTTATGYNGISIGAIRIRSSLYYMRGTIQEVIYYLSDQSSNMVGIEENINDFYSIY